MTPSDPSPGSPRAVLWLALGAAAGLAAAALALLWDGEGRGLPAHAAASVNGELIRLEELDRALAALSADRREPLAITERERVLDRLIEEELLVQRGLELGLARHDRRVRGDIVSAVIELVVSQAGDTEPSQDELREFYAANRDYFARSERLQVDRLFVRAGSLRSGDAARERARRAAARLRAGEDFSAVEAELGDPQVARVPAGLLPPAKLREYLGPAAAKAAGALELGAISDPMDAPGGVAVLRLVARAPGFAPPFDEVESAVRAELRRRAGDEALRRYLESLRERADLGLREPGA